VNADSNRWIDRKWLREVQYGSDENLVARQSIYSFQRPELNLPKLVLDLVSINSGDTIVDVGCGNGLYLAETSLRADQTSRIGVDLSLGMLASAHTRNPTARLINADAIFVPLRNELSDVTIAAHMLYHAARPKKAIRELRRITRRGGRTLVVLNARDHLQEMRQIVSELFRGDADTAREYPWGRIDLDRGGELMSEVYASVRRIDFPAELVLTDPAPIERYLRSMGVVKVQSSPDWFVKRIIERIPWSPSREFRVRTRAGCLLCI
jgi:SAM-dependent methyltransferase